MKLQVTVFHCSSKSRSRSKSTSRPKIKLNRPDHSITQSKSRQFSNSASQAKAGHRTVHSQGHDLSVGPLITTTIQFLHQGQTLQSILQCDQAHIRNKSITHSLNTGHQQSPDQGRGQTPYSARLLTGRVQLAMPQATVGQFPTLKTEQEPTTQNFTHKQTLHKDHNMMKTKL